MPLHFEAGCRQRSLPSISIFLPPPCQTSPPSDLISTNRISCQSPQKRSCRGSAGSRSLPQNTDVPCCREWSVCPILNFPLRREAALGNLTAFPEILTQYPTCTLPPMNTLHCPWRSFCAAHDCLPSTGTDLHKKPSCHPQKFHRRLRMSNSVFSF